MQHVKYVKSESPWVVGWPAVRVNHGSRSLETSPLPFRAQAKLWSLMGRVSSVSIVKQKSDSCHLWASLSLEEITLTSRLRKIDRWGQPTRQPLLIMALSRNGLQDSENDFPIWRDNEVWTIPVFFSIRPLVSIVGKLVPVIRFGCISAALHNSLWHGLLKRESRLITISLLAVLVNDFSPRVYKGFLTTCLY